jgi:hypothetical protein
MDSDFQEVVAISALSLLPINTADTTIHVDLVALIIDYPR